MGGILAFLIYRDMFTGRDAFSKILDSIVDGFRNPPTQDDFALCAP